MPYGTIKVDTITFTSGSSDVSVAISGLVQNPTFSGNVTVTGTVSGTIVRGNTVSGATVTGTAGQFGTLTGNTAGFTTITGTTVTGTTGSFTSGVFASGTAAAPSVSVGTTTNGIYSPASNEVAISTNGAGRLFVDSSGKVSIVSSQDTFFSGAQFRIGDSANDVGIQLAQSSANAGAPRLVPTKSRGTLASPNAVIANDQLFTIRPAGYVGSTGGYVQGAQIGVFTDGTPTDASNGLGGYVTISTREVGGTLNERLRITSAGLVGIGTTTPSSALEVFGAANVTDNTVTLRQAPAGTVGYFGTSTNHPLGFRVNNTEYARIDSSGKLLVGTSSARANFFNSTLSPVVQVEGANSNANRLQSLTYGFAGVDGPVFTFGKHRDGSVGGNTLVVADDQLGWISFQGSDGTEFVEGASIRAFVDGTPGANDMPGRLVFSTTADGASSPTERMRIGAAGEMLLGKTSSTITAAGLHFSTSGGVSNFVASGTRLFDCNRLVDDGELIAFWQASSQEGSISVSGTTVSYNGAHLSRWSQIPGIDPYDKTVRPEILRGTVMSNLDEMCDWVCPTSGDCQDNEQLNKTKVSDVEGDKNVAGVFQSWDDDDDTWVNDYYLAMTGDFVIRIAAGVTVERGDLLMSAGDGTAKPQDDDIIRSKTIAKVTSTNVSCTYDDGSYCVPCVLMAC